MTNSHTAAPVVDHVPDFASLDPLGVALGATALVSAAALVAARRSLAPFTPSDDAGLVARASSAGRSVGHQRRIEFFTQSH